MDKKECKYWTGTEAIKEMKDRGWTTRFGQRVAEIETKYPDLVQEGTCEKDGIICELAVSSKENGVLDDAIVLVTKEGTK